MVRFRVFDFDNCGVFCFIILLPYSITDVDVCDNLINSSMDIYNYMRYKNSKK